MTDQALDLAVRMVAGALRPDDEPTSVELPLEVGALVELVQALVRVSEHGAAYAMSESFLLASVPEVVMSMAGDDAVYQAPDRTRADWAAKAADVIGEVWWGLAEGPFRAQAADRAGAGRGRLVGVSAVVARVRADALRPAVRARASCPAARGTADPQPGRRRGRLQEARQPPPFPTRPAETRS